MITLRFTHKENQYRAVSDGHADYNTGNDIVCAAVSAIMFTLIGSLANLTENSSQLRNIVEDGHMDIRFRAVNETDRYVAALLFNSAIIGVAQICEKYPDHVGIIK